MSAIARIGDRGNHGGTIITGSSNYLCRGSMVALTGDIYQCSVHGRQELVGRSHFKIHGKSVVLVGDRAKCGSVIQTGAGGTDFD